MCNAFIREKESIKIYLQKKKCLLELFWYVVGVIIKSHWFLSSFHQDLLCAQHLSELQGVKHWQFSKKKKPKIKTKTNNYYYYYVYNILFINKNCTKAKKLTCNMRSMLQLHLLNSFTFTQNQELYAHLQNKFS